MTTQLIALTGLSAAAKQQASLHLLNRFTEQGLRVALLDNNDLPFSGDYPFQAVRLGGECVCCSLAEQLITTVSHIDAERVVLPVSMKADPAALQQILAGLGIPTYTLNWNVSNLPIPYLKERLAAFADLNVVSLEELDASLRL